MVTARRPAIPYAPWGVAVLFVLALGAFWPGYLSRVGEPIDSYTHAHALVMTAWMALLIVQPVLVARGQRALHRTLGTLSVGLVVGVVAAGMLLAHQRLAGKSEEEFARVAYSFYLPLSSVILFLIPYTLGLLYRRRREVHGRFMLATLVAGMDPIFARLAYFSTPSLPEDVHQLASYCCIQAILLLIVWNERREHHGKWIIPFVMAVTLMQQVGYYTLARTDGFRDFADWYRHLPLT